MGLCVVTRWNGQAKGRQVRDAPATVGFRPLYRQVYDTLLKRLADAVWQPGQILPSEGQLAVELGVSQGTVRKALDALTADSLLVRRQGRGTFVADHDDKQSVFRFLKLRPDGEGSGMPTSRVTAIAEAAASADERGRLDLVRSARVVRIERVRAVDAKLCVAETISVPAGLFPGIAGIELPNTLYSLYATRYGITIATANERLKAVAIGAREADAAPGARRDPGPRDRPGRHRSRGAAGRVAPLDLPDAGHPLPLGPALTGILSGAGSAPEPTSAARAKRGAR